MENNIKKRNILLIVIVLGALLIFLFVFMKDSDSSPSDLQQVTDLPVLESKTRPLKTLGESSDVTIQTPEGAVILRDPRTLPDTVAMGTDIFSLTTLENINPVKYGIIFNESNGSFAVGLEKEPIAQTRLEAEQYLMDTLSISQTEMCLLNIFVGVPYSINTFYSGRNLGLSFCPGSVSLE